MSAGTVRGSTFTGGLGLVPDSGSGTGRVQGSEQQRQQQRTQPAQNAQHCIVPDASAYHLHQHATLLQVAATA